ncbi:MAG: recombinase family protein [Alphaproteobacteria bacterium]|nr:recombinase family protein [Rickettsiales bacterium]
MKSTNVKCPQKAIIFARVSSQAKQEGCSLDAQIHRLQEYCKRKEFDVVKEFQLVESSTTEDRKCFIKMTDFINQQEGKVDLICDAVDRLQRNFKEVPILEELRIKGKLTLHFLRENQVLDKKANSAQLMAYQMFVMISTVYANSISDNVKRAIQSKLEHGELTRKAPIGYKNITLENSRKDVVIDKAKSLIITELFEDYSTGKFKLKEIYEKYSEKGLTNTVGNKLSLSVLANILKNPFYYGEMKVKGKLYPHRYTKLISGKLLQQCQR